MDVLLEKPAKGVALLRLNRPEKRNALNLEMRRLLAEHCTTLGQDEDTRVLVITGGPDMFCAGADLDQMVEATPLDIMNRPVGDYWAAIARCPKPIIAAIEGFALGGGCELALHCDIIIAGENASLGQPEIRVGIIPGAGGTQRLVRAVGKFQAMRMVLTGATLTGAQAFSVGLASEAVPDGEALERALKTARLIAKMPPVSVRLAKEVLLAGADAPLETAIMLEQKAFQLLFSTRDQTEGMRAFLEKRKPEYTGE
jgi:enoyl-CoA hydratase/carnithine racemase